MVFSVSFPTRHTDTFAGTGFVHAGVLLALTELAYARLEQHLGISKPAHVVAVERETRAIYAAPLPWQEGAAVEVRTTDATQRGFAQEFTIRSAASGQLVATFVHQWVWLDTTTGRRAPLPVEVVEALLADQ
jgi:acyl-CoA thioesterase FadM